MVIKKLYIFKTMWYQQTNTDERNRTRGSVSPRVYGHGIPNHYHGCQDNSREGKALSDRTSMYKTVMVEPDIVTPYIKTNH